VLRHGDVAFALARQGAEVIGLDFSAPMLAVARSVVPVAVQAIGNRPISICNSSTATRSRFRFPTNRSTS